MHTPYSFFFIFPRCSRKSNRFAFQVHWERSVSWYWNLLWLWRIVRIRSLHFLKHKLWYLILSIICHDKHYIILFISYNLYRLSHIICDAYSDFLTKTNFFFKLKIVWIPFGILKWHCWGSIFSVRVSVVWTSTSPNTVYKLRTVYGWYFRWRW